MFRAGSAVRFAISIASFLALTLPTHAQAPSPAGVVKTVAGKASILHLAQERPAAPGGQLVEGDILRTGADGRLGVTLKDGTRLSLGANTELRIDAFTYAPAQGRLAIALKVARGVVAYVSGRIAQLAPGAVKIETPTSVIGIRGTHVLIGVDQP